jgi:membrane-bound metal-dependent hydrolase YbcI (DUF457 family)
MDPVTHALTSVALSRAGLSKTARFATPMLVVSGLVADLDLLSYFAGPSAYSHAHRTWGHSLVGSFVLALVVAAAFSRLADRKGQAPLPFARALGLCAIGAGAHLLLDLGNPAGVRLLWPLRGKWIAWDLLRDLDPWILFVLLAGLLLPGLFHLVSEEIGDRREGKGPLRGAIAALIIVILYIGARSVYHSRAVDLLLSSEYHGAVPEAAGAFPLSTSPLNWRGVVATANTFEEIEVSFAPGSYFDPDHSLTHYKPEPSPAIEASQSAPIVERFMGFAQFPLASLDRIEDGYHFELRDLRFAPSPGSLPEVIAVVDLDTSLRVTREKLQYETPAQR